MFQVALFCFPFYGSVQFQKVVFRFEKNKGRLPFRKSRGHLPFSRKE
jgi:hypothetical protein